MAERYFALQLNGGIGLSKTHQNCEGVAAVYVLTAEEWAKWKALYLAVNQQDRHAMLSAVCAIDGGTYDPALGGKDADA